MHVPIWTALLLVPAALATGALYQWVAFQRDRHRFPAPGRIVDGVHLQDLGTGAPVVVFESGLAASSLSWIWVQPEVAKLTRTVSYDRRGLGWSAAPHTKSHGPRNLASLVDELRATLIDARIPGPYILVGHSYGGLIVRAFAGWFPSDVAGLVLVDPVLPSEWIAISPERARMLRIGAALSRRGAWLARLGVVRFALALLMAGSRTIPMFIARASSGPGAGVMARLAGVVQKLPRELWPVVISHWCNPDAFHTMADYLDALPENSQTAERLGLPQVPVVTISAAQATADQQREWQRLGTHVPSARAGHWIQLDEPELVINAIREMLIRMRD